MALSKSKDLFAGIDLAGGSSYTTVSPSAFKDMTLDIKVLKTAADMIKEQQLIRNQYEKYMYDYDYATYRGIGVYDGKSASMPSPSTIEMYQDVCRYCGVSYRLPYSQYKLGRTHGCRFEVEYTRYKLEESAKTEPPKVNGLRPDKGYYDEARGVDKTYPSAIPYNPPKVVTQATTAPDQLITTAHGEPNHARNLRKVFWAHQKRNAT